MSPVKARSDPKNFIDAVKYELKSRGWSQKRFAEFLERDESTVSLWLSGKNKPRLDDEPTITQLAKFLHKTPSAIRHLITADEKEEATSAQENVTVIQSVEELEYLFNEKKIPPEFLSLAIPLNTFVALTGLRQKLREQYSYDVVEDHLDHYLQDHQKDLFPPNQELKWLKKPAGGVTRKLKEKDNEEWKYEVLRSMCLRLNEEFMKTSDECLLEETLIDLLNTKVPTDREFSSVQFIQNLIEWKLLERRPEGKLVRRWILNPEFVINRSLGIPLSIRGLNFLFEGGLRPPSTTGLSLLLEGAPGTGKSMLGIQLGAILASYGYLVLYLAAEEDVNRIMQRLVFAGYTQTPQRGNDFIRFVERVEEKFTLIEEFTLTTVNFLSVDFIPPPDSTSKKQERTSIPLPQPNKGSVVLVSLPSSRLSYDSQSDFQRSLADFLEQVVRVRDAYNVCCIIDSIDAVVDGFQGERKLYEALFNFAKNQAQIGIFISKDHGGDPDWSGTYLADIVIKLGYRQRNNYFKERVIEILKCRTQDAKRGLHQFSIQSGRGITVYPSVQSRLSVWGQRIRRTINPTAVHWKLGLYLDLENIFNGDVVESSAMLLTGPPATHKFPLGLSFLASSLMHDPETRVFIVSLREDEAAIRRLIRIYPQFHPLLCGDSDSLSPHVAIFHRPPDYYTAERFLDWMATHVEEFAGNRPTRMLFSNLSQLKFNSPLVEQEPLFIAALIEFCRRKDITSLFIDVKNPYQETIGDIFDVILRTDVEPNQPELVKFWVGNSGPCNADRTPKWVERLRAPDDANRGYLVLKQSPDEDIDVSQVYYSPL